MIPLANTGTDRINKNEVIIIAQQNKLIQYKFKNFGFRIRIEIIKFIDLIIDDVPFKCKEKIIKLIDKFLWIINGG